jgi:multidrug resistance efflux pump
MKQFLRRLIRNSGRPALTVVIVALALVAGRQLWAVYEEAPWTRDGRIRADVVTIAPDVSGLVTEVAVRDNQTVKCGDVLFRIDPDRFELALAQADAAMASRKAQMDEAAREATRYERLNEIAVSKKCRNKDRRMPTRRQRPIGRRSPTGQLRSST